VSRVRSAHQSIKVGTSFVWHGLRQGGVCHDSVATANPASNGVDLVSGVPLANGPAPYGTRISTHVYDISCPAGPVPAESRFGD